MNLNGRKVVNQIGKGTYSLVYDVFSPQGNTRQAIKLNFTELNLTGPSYKEIIANLNLAHYYIMRIRDISEGDLISQCHGQYDIEDYSDVRPDKLHFIYPLAITDLDMWLSYNKNILTYDNSMSMFSQICMGLEHIHDMNYIHRDLKPSNILVCSENGGLQCKIGDMGMAKYFIKNDDHITTIQTVYYRAPEVAMGYTNYDLSSDIWSLGCILYEILKGYKLVELKEDNNHTLMKILSEILPYQIPIPYIHKINSKFILDIVGNTKKISIEEFNTPMLNIMQSVSPDQLQKTFNSIVGMLNFDHNIRPTISQILDSDMFSNPIRKVILETRKAMHHNNTSSRNSLIGHSNMCFERSRMCELVMKIFNNRFKYEWYNHRILFQTIYNFDRLLMMKSSLVSLDLTIVIHSLLYVSHKIVADRGNEKTHYNFIKDISSELLIKDIEVMEYKLFKDIFKYNVFYPTIYDIALNIEIVPDNDVLSMLKYVINAKYFNKTSTQALNEWKLTK